MQQGMALVPPEEQECAGHVVPARTEEEKMILKATLVAAAVTLATSSFAQQQQQQQPQTPGDSQPKAQGEMPSNARPTKERDTSLPTTPNDTGSRGGESRTTGDRS